MRFKETFVPRSASAFTLIELMLAISIMTVIIVGLYAVFDQTQKALRGTVAQVDVMESVRSTIELMTRELQQAVPVAVTDTNYASFSANANPVTVPIDLQRLDNKTLLFRTGLQDIYFLTRQNDQWTALGYWVGPSNTNQLGQPYSLGRLYRFHVETTSAALVATNLFGTFQSQFRLTNSQPVMDGVVHMRLTAYDHDGKPLTINLTTNTPNELRPWGADVAPAYAGETRYLFTRSTIPRFPAAIELELGVLEPQMVVRFRSIPVAEEARKFIARNAGRIHLFRQRVPLRNAFASY